MEELRLCMQPAFLRVIYFMKVALNIVRFLVSTMINLVMHLIETFLGVNTYNGITECYEFATLDYIKLLEEEVEEEELKKYLTEKEQLLEKAAQHKLAYKKSLESNLNALKIGKNANNKNAIKCGDGSKYNTNLYNNVRTAGYKTREGVVAAALYLSSHIDVHIPYFWAGGHHHSFNDYKDYGDNFMGVSNKWGCLVKMAFGGTDVQKNGVNYPFGVDCSGFVNRAILDGGYYTGDSSQWVHVSTNVTPPSSIASIKISTVKASNAKGKIKPGDIAHKKGHVGMVVEVSDNFYKVAEAAGYKEGLVIKKYKYGSGFTSIILMDNFYQNYKKGEPSWDGFK